MSWRSTISVPRNRDLNRSTTNIPSACRIANIAINDAMILPYDANLARIEFSEGIPLASDQVYFNRLVVVLHRDVLAGVVTHERRRHYAHHRASGDVDGNRVAGVIRGEQGCRDKRRRSTSDYGGKLITQRGAAVAQPGREGLGKQCCLRPILHVMRDERQDDCDEHCCWNCSVHHTEIQEAK